MSRTATLGSIEEEAYASLYRQLLVENDLTKPLPTLKTELDKKLKDCKAIPDPDEEQKKTIADMEALQKQYQQLLDNQQKLAKEQFRFIPIFEDDPLVSVEVILPDGPDLEAKLDQNELLNRFMTPVSTTGTSATNIDPVLSLGISRPLNSVLKVNYENYSMSFDPSDKIVLNLKDPNLADPAPYSEDAIRNLQKHVLASVVRNPDAPISIKFPPTFSDQEKFRILNEMMIAYALRTDVLGAQSPKDSIKRRNQFLQQLINGGTIKLSDTVDVNGEARKMDTWDMWSMKEHKAGFIRHYSKSTTDLSHEYADQLRKTFRVEAMREMMNSVDIENTLNAAIHSKLTNAPGIFSKIGNYMMDADGKSITNEQNRAILKGSLAELVKMVKDNPSHELDDDIRKSKPFKALKKFGIEETELTEFLNSPNLKAYLTNTPNPQPDGPRMI